MDGDGLEVPGPVTAGAPEPDEEGELDEGAERDGVSDGVGRGEWDGLDDGTGVGVNVAGVDVAGVGVRVLGAG